MFESFDAMQLKTYKWKILETIFIAVEGGWLCMKQIPPKKALGIKHNLINSLLESACKTTSPILQIFAGGSIFTIQLPYCPSNCHLDLFFLLLFQQS